MKAKQILFPGFIDVDSTSLQIINDKLTLDLWATELEKFAHTTKSLSWWIGDYLIWGENKFGEDIWQYVEAFGFGYETLRNIMYVCRNVSASSRRDALSFRHHSTIAKLSPDQQSYWLDIAEKETLSSTQLASRLPIVDKDTQKTIEEVDRHYPHVILEIDKMKLIVVIDGKKLQLYKTKGKYNIKKLRDNPPDIQCDLKKYFPNTIVVNEMVVSEFFKKNGE